MWFNMKNLVFEQHISLKSCILPFLTSVKNSTGTTCFTATFPVKMYKVFSCILLQIKTVTIWAIQRSIAIFITNCLEVFSIVMRIFFFFHFQPSLDFANRNDLFYCLTMFNYDSKILVHTL